MPLATPFSERSCRCRAPETSCARGRYSIDEPTCRDPVAYGDLVESYSTLRAHSVVRLLLVQATAGKPLSVPVANLLCVDRSHYESSAHKEGFPRATSARLRPLLRRGVEVARDQGAADVHRRGVTALAEPNHHHRSDGGDGLDTAECGGPLVPQPLEEGHHLRRAARAPRPDDQPPALGKESPEEGPLPCELVLRQPRPAGLERVHEILALEAARGEGAGAAWVEAAVRRR